MAETVEFIKKLREKNIQVSKYLLNKNNIRFNKNLLQCKINVKPFLVPHFYSSGIIYEIEAMKSPINLRLSKGSEYKVHERCGVGFSLNLSSLIDLQLMQSK